ncbi:hypothetical protein RB598_000268 [Gaeumannomyces tritici]
MDAAAAAAGPSSGSIAAALDVTVSDENSSNNDSTDPAAVATARPPPKKRRRLVISCVECHRRKQKCDRGYPCTNCRSRGKEHACRYETAATPGAKAGSGGGGGSGPSTAAPAPSTGENTPAQPASDGGGGDDGTGTGKAANFGYAAAGGASTMGFLRRIDRATSSPGLAGDSLTRITAEAGRLADDFGTRERYRCLIRQLPARVYVEKLVGVFFEKYNIQYYPLEYDVFMAQLAEWNSLPFSVFTTVGPRGLSPTLRAFPAVLFQVAAMGLLSLGSDEPHPVYDALKYAGDMTFEDVASDYSESGVAVLSLLGKRQMSLCTVQAGFIRCFFLKYMAQVTEAWHAIGAAIRDAQEIGLHREDQDPRPVVTVAAGVEGEGEDDAAAAAVLRNQWEVQHRRSLWHMLCLWDVHTGLVLGRPLTTDGDAQPPFPVDCPVPTGGLEARSRTAVLPRGPDDPPTPMTRNLWTVRLLPLLREVARLEASGPCPRDFDRVDQIHREMEALEAQIPPCFRVDNPDTRFDDHPACRGWLRGVRTILPQLASFGYFVLHRPYVFTRPRSRAVALRACVDMLKGQRTQFEGMAPDEHRSFAVFFGTFDAIVLLATVFVLFPREHPDLLPDALQHFSWAVERFEVLSRRNNLARSAVAVLRAIWVRLQRSLARSSAVVPVDPRLAAAAADSDVISPFSSGSGLLGVTPSTASAATAAVPPTSDVSISISGGDGNGNGHENSSDGGLDTLLLARTSAEPWSLPSDFDWSSIQTLYPTTDLAYNELMTGDHGAFAGAGGFLDDGGTETAVPTELQTWPPPSHGFFGSGGGEGDAPAPGVVPAGAAASGTGLAGADPGGTQGQQNNTAWQFEGDFGDDSIWQVLNLYTPF